MEHFFVDGESGFSIEAFQSATFGFQLAELRSKPGCRLGEGNSPCL